MAIPSTDQESEEGLTLRRKVFFGVFFFACALYLIVPIIDAVT